MKITKESQDQLEIQIRDDYAKMGFKLYGLHVIPGGDIAYKMSVDLYKLLIEYFDNTRLLQNQPKEKVEL